MEYAADGNGEVAVKGELIPGQVREMNKKTTDKDPLYTRIGDRQYHHFKVEIPKKVKKATVILKGYKGENDFDLTLAVCKDGLAFHNKTDIKNVSLGCDKALVLDKPQAGTWYISVFCETTVTAENGANGVVYTGRTDVLNGVPYSIQVELEK